MRWARHWSRSKLVDKNSQLPSLSQSFIRGRFDNKVFTFDNERTQFSRRTTLWRQMAENSVCKGSERWKVVWVQGWWFRWEGVGWLWEKRSIHIHSSLGSREKQRWRDIFFFLLQEYFQKRFFIIFVNMQLERIFRATRSNISWCIFLSGSQGERSYEDIADTKTKNTKEGVVIITIIMTFDLLSWLCCWKWENYLSFQFWLEMKIAMRKTTIRSKMTSHQSSEDLLQPGHIVKVSIVISDDITSWL